MAGTAQSASWLERLLAALFYAATSLLIMFLNKIVLTVYGFPSFLFLALCQFAVTVVFLLALRMFQVVSFPRFSLQVLHDVFPLPLIFLLNTGGELRHATGALAHQLTGLGGTKNLSLPMMTVLRRFSIVMTMMGEYYVLSIRSSKGVQASVFMMVGGAIVAALDDLGFDAWGYTYILLNDFFTAANGVIMKQKLDAKKLGTYGLLFYNSMFSIPCLLLVVALDQQRHLIEPLAFPYWTEPTFVLCFLSSAILGALINYSIMWCTQVNSALTTTVVGCLKNILSTYLGMFLGGDYIFTIVNFLGLNISVLGSVVYTVVKYKEETEEPKLNAAQPATPASVAEPVAAPGQPGWTCDRP